MKGNEYGQTILYACVAISQWNHFSQLIYTNKIKYQNLAQENKSLYLYIYPWKEIDLSTQEIRYLGKIGNKN